MGTKGKKHRHPKTSSSEPPSLSGGTPTPRISSKPVVRYPNLEKKERSVPAPPKALATSAAASHHSLLKPRSKAPLWIGGVGLYCVLVYGTYIYLASGDDSSVQVKSLDEQFDISHVYDQISGKYDKGIGKSEFFMAMPLLRRKLSRRAEGDVLEASVGTGRNLKYYKMKKINSLTMVDCSSSMLDEARKVFQRRHPSYKNVNFVVQDAAVPIRTPSGAKFDTVVQSMGVCSHHSPVQLMRSLEDSCKSDGKIILLEHGRSYYDWLNKILDRYADRHAETWGCWWNRDVEGIARRSGLDILKIERYHLGTTYYIEAKPGPEILTK